jgi:hypothetical protein
MVLSIGIMENADDYPHQYYEYVYFIHLSKQLSILYDSYPVNHLNTSPSTVPAPDLGMRYSHLQYF